MKKRAQERGEADEHEPITGAKSGEPGLGSRYDVHGRN